MKNRSQLLDVAFVHAVEIVLDYGLYGKTIMAHGLCSFCMIKSPWKSLFAQIVAVGFRDDLPAVTQFHRHQIIGEIARRQLAAHLDEGGLIIGAVDGDDEILARLAFGLGG